MNNPLEHESRSMPATRWARTASTRCRFQVGSGMLFEMIPVYLEFFGFPGTAPEQLRELATLQY